MLRRTLKYFMIVAAIASLLGEKAEAGKQTTRTVQLTAGKADTVDLGRAVADVLVANPAVADVGTLRASRLYIVGKAIGDTNVLAFDEEGNQLANITVRVRVDEQNLRDTMREFFPNEQIEVKTVKDEIVLKGKVSTPAVANQARDVAGRFVTPGKTLIDLMAVRGEQQVMLRVKVIEANRNVLREYGIDTSLRNGFGGNVGVGFNSAASGLSGVPFGVGSIAMDKRGAFGPLSVAIQALERDGIVNTLAEPNLTAISGETAGFLAGGEYPVPVGRDQDGNVTLEFKKFGVALNFTPTVLSEDRISMQLSTEVSAKSDDNSLTLVGIKVPGLTVRRADTTVEMGSGGTLMIAGLIRSDTLDSLNGVPGVKDTPILGELFKSKSFTRNESELIILVTPYVVNPYGEEQAVREDQMPQPKPLPQSAALTPALPVPSATGANLPPPPALGQAATGSVTLQDRTVSTAANAPAVNVRENIAPQADRLSGAFIRNLQTVYGSRAPAGAAGSGPYGYIVD